jgi:hypothetical protein
MLRTPAAETASPSADVLNEILSTSPEVELKLQTLMLSIPLMDSQSVAKSRTME